MKQADVERMIEKWTEGGVINAEQAHLMLHDLKTTTSEQSGKKLVTILSLVGAAVLTAGVLLVIASNWSFLGKPVQLLLAVLLPVVPLSIAYYIAEVRQSTSILSRVANIFGIGLIGGALSLIGQIYNLESGYQTLMLLWFVLSLPFVFVYKRPENFGVSAILAGLAIFTWILKFFGSWWSDAQSLTITLTVVLLVYCLALYVIGVSLRNSAVWGSGARVLRLLSASVGTVTLFITTFEFYARVVTDSGYRDAGWIPLSIILNVLFISFLVFVLIQAVKHQEERLVYSVVRMMFIYLLVKYFTLFSTMLDTGILFILGGILFIAGAWLLEKNKHHLLMLVKADERPVTSTPGEPQLENTNLKDHE